MLDVRGNMVYEVIETEKARIEQFYSMINKIKIENLKEVTVGSDVSFKIQIVNYLDDPIEYNGIVKVILEDGSTYDYPILKGKAEVLLVVNDLGVVRLSFDVSEMGSVAGEVLVIE